MNETEPGSKHNLRTSIPRLGNFGIGLVLILTITLVDSLITLYGSGAGNIEIISHLFYIPIILMAYFYPRWGVEFSLVIGTLYILLNIPFTSDPLVISKIFLLSGIFVGVGGIVSLLSASQAEGKKRYQTIFEASSGGLFTISKNDLLITDGNPEFLSVMGYRTSELIGQPFSVLWHSPADMNRFLNLIRRSGKATGFETELTAADGSRKYVILSGNSSNKEDIICSLNDLTERKKAELLLLKSEERIRAFFRDAPIGIALFERSGDLLDANEAFIDTFRLSGQGVRSGCNLFLMPFITEQYVRNLNDGKNLTFQFTTNPEFFSQEDSGRDNDASKKILEMRISPIRVGEKEIIDGYMVLAQDITGILSAQDALFESEERYHALFENANDPTFIHDLNGNIIEANRIACEVLGYSHEEILSFSLAEIEDISCHSTIRMHIDELSEHGEAIYDTILYSSNGNKIQVEISARIILYKDMPAILCSARDITERKRYEEQLKASLNEKEILLKEVHHRVKNNMQVITSLIKLQSCILSDDRAIAQFAECERRVRSMALVHELLYQSRNLESINASGYIHKLVSDIVSSSSLNKNIKLEISVEDIEMDLNTAIPCGLIINELVTNAMKYAFQRQDQGTIRISLIVFQEKEYVLTVSDDGMGLPDTFDSIGSETLGMQIVHVLVQQLDGNIKISDGNGAHFVIRFPNK